MKARKTTPLLAHVWTQWCKLRDW